MKRKYDDFLRESDIDEDLLNFIVDDEEYFDSDSPSSPSSEEDTNIDIQKLETIEDLIEIGRQWLDKNRKKSRKLSIYGRVSNIIEDLRELRDMIGMKSLKNSILEQIIFFGQGLHQNEIMHTVLYGEPGTGKTTVGEILCRIYAKLGILSKGHYTIANRNDFVGKYLGHTADKTEKFLKRCIGGVLFIDEAYSLGPEKSGGDSFSKEVIDTLNQFLSENTQNFICIIAGYEDSLKKCFFNKNVGLDRRFPWRFYMDKYSNEDLLKIFIYCIEKANWRIDFTPFLPAFDPKVFNNNGGDCKILFDRCKMAHSRRIFMDKNAEKFVLNDSDFKQGYKNFLNIKKEKSNKPPPEFMYI